MRVEKAEQNPIAVEDPEGVLRLLKKAEWEIQNEGEFSEETKSMARFLRGEIPRPENIKEPRFMAESRPRRDPAGHPEITRA